MVLAFMGAASLIPSGLYLSAVAWGARLPPFREAADRLYLIVPGQLMAIAGVLCAFAGLGFSISEVSGWLSAVMTHGGP